MTEPRKRGRPFSADGPQFTIRKQFMLSPDLAEALKQLAGAKSESESAYVRALIRQEMGTK